jgi:hypothetical protein
VAAATAAVGAKWRRRISNITGSTASSTNQWAINGKIERRQAMRCEDGTAFVADLALG